MPKIKYTTATSENFRLHEGKFKTFFYVEFEDTECLSHPELRGLLRMCREYGFDSVELPLSFKLDIDEVLK